GNLGSRYFDWLTSRYSSSGGRADLVAYFFRLAFQNLRSGGCFGLIATNTIRQGDTREAGLAAIVGEGGKITSALVRLPWPGDAAVTVSTIHVQKDAGSAKGLLDGRAVDQINSFLLPLVEIEKPFPLAPNANFAFKGVDLYGMGFTFDDTRRDGGATPISVMNQIIKEHPRESDRIRPYLGGEEINTSPTHSPH